jgi:hypothetical protein
LQTIGIFICGLLVAYGIAFAFFKGFKKWANILLQF